MCLDFPGRVASREGDVATVEVDGRTRTASTLLVPDVRIGEWVYVTAGTIIDRLSDAEALRISTELRKAKETTR